MAAGGFGRIGRFPAWLSSGVHNRGERERLTTGPDSWLRTMMRDRLPASVVPVLRRSEG